MSHTATWKWTVFVAVTVLVVHADAADKPDHALIKLLGDELRYSMDKLSMSGDVKPYYIAYTITDEKSVNIGAELGALTGDDVNAERLLDVDVRVGDHGLDNTHKIRGDFGFDPSDMFGGAAQIALEDDTDAIKHAIWLATDRAFKSAVKKYQRVQTNLKTKVEEEDQSDDFSREEANVHGEPVVAVDVDRGAWADRLRAVSKIALDHPLIYGSSVRLTASAGNRFMVTSEGTSIQTGRKLLRVIVSASTKAEDGMDLSQSFLFNTSQESKLPSQSDLEREFKKVIAKVEALREAPLVEPYTGPAILLNRASGVFFHEIFGHRVEGHRQKDVEEGQTFTNKVGKEVLPDFLSVYDNPTIAEFQGEDLRGFYRFDDEGVASQNVALVENGILKTFLLSRSPVEGFPKSNGHGRRQPGRKVVARQGNLTVKSDKTVSFDKLRDLLLEECKSQGKEYGYLFEDITGGFTSTQRFGAQSFKVLPVVVYRVYVDGRPDELVRGVDIVGTPLTSFTKIIYTGDDPAVFNGTCGAESGWVPVSAVSPSILVSQIEIEKRRRDQDKPPILDPPIAQRGM